MSDTITAEVVRQFELEVHGVRLSLSIDATGIGPAATPTDRLSRRSELIAAVRRLGAGCAAALGEILDAEEASAPAAPDTTTAPAAEVAEVLWRSEDGFVFRSTDGATYARGRVTGPDGVVVFSDALLYRAERKPETLTAAEAETRAYRLHMAGHLGPNVVARLRPPTKAERDAAEVERLRTPPPPVAAGLSPEQLADRQREEAFRTLGELTRAGLAPPESPPPPERSTLEDRELFELLRGRAAQRAVDVARAWPKP